jgi:hypothetical protein
MTLLQFIKSKLEDDTPIGDLARAANEDKEFNSRKTDKERLSYLSFATTNISDVYDDFLEEFNSVK